MDNILIINAVVLWVVVITNFLITLVLVRRLTELLELARGAQRPEMIKVGEKAPQMKLVNLTGSIVTDAQLIGREVAMVFISPGCQPCRNVMPELETLYWRTKDIGVEMMIVSLTNSDATQSFVNEIGFDAPIYIPLMILPSLMISKFNQLHPSICLISVGR